MTEADIATMRAVLAERVAARQREQRFLVEAWRQYGSKGISFAQRVEARVAAGIDADARAIEYVCEVGS